jgi:soluble lytic murein transglycosylase-like protein
MRSARIWPLLLLLLIGTANAQPSEIRGLRDVSERWAEYYAGIYRIPVELVKAIIDEESDWNPYAVSSKGAAGLMQLMPATAARFGVRNRFYVPENIRGGVAYLAWLNQRFQGDLRLITAGYYAGESSISSMALVHSSPEIQEYVKRVAEKYRARRAQKGANRIRAIEATLR